MNKKYIFPLQLFIILEKINVKIWVNQSLNFNNYYVYFSEKWFLLFTQVLKNEVFLTNSTLIEHSGVDMLQVLNFKSNKWFYFFSRFQLIYNIYLYSVKTRLTLFFLVSKKQKQVKKIPSVDRYFLNANWLERESSEMYGVFFFFKRDTRKLLLDYSKVENPLLKDFPSEGFYNVFYNFFFNQVNTVKNEIVEL